MSIDDIARHLIKPAIEFRPELRWWLAEGLHTDETIRHEIDTAHRLGFGGMEFLAMDEDEIDHSRYGWGSEEWVHDSQLVVEETTARKMSVSFTSGTNWSNANLPTIDADHPAAARELDVVTEDLEAGSSRTGPLPKIDLGASTAETALPGHRGVIRNQDLVAVVAVRRSGVTGDAASVLDVDSVLDLTDLVRDEALDWTAPGAGSWSLFSFWSHGTGQTASPSATTNWTVNYVERAGVDAVIDYWKTVVLTPELREQIAKNPRAQMYMDSLELSTYGAGGLFWGPNVAREFRERRGYEIAPWLPFLIRSAPFMASSTVYHHEPLDSQRDTVEKVRFDYVRTLTDLYIENMIRPFAAFLHENGMTLRSEISYGLPFELTRPGPEVDGIETESLEFASQIDAYRLLAGPAHLFGKQYSSETGATTRNHMLDHRFYDQIIATQLAAGITKTVLHGWASTAGAEGVTEWPGHEGMWNMFSERFDTRQPASEFYPSGTMRWVATSTCCARGNRASTWESCTPTTSPTTPPGWCSSTRTATGRLTRSSTGRRGCATGRTTGGRISGCRTRAGPTSSSTARSSCATTSCSAATPRATPRCSRRAPVTRRSSCSRALSILMSPLASSSWHRQAPGSSSCTARRSSSSS
ncbi:hypothetical protein GCM10025867_30780 [Frondihabitans sucicola]|uniref:Uncharacterized protein n=1 Tax=Frondihabitans sucicola TaxID=1268041 RepID=A0ABN6Y428_9MICO|nr:glycosyl hydrolase [Frondihabitans sucicola]BDZ50837.1 hypothetical protein GCM10025867_30780 [Frondihabitans sucicola]